MILFPEKKTKMRGFNTIETKKLEYNLIVKNFDRARYSEQILFCCNISDSPLDSTWELNILQIIHVCSY